MSASHPWTAWVGRTEQHTDVISGMQCEGLSATLDRDDAEVVRGTELPPLWHWMYFPAIAKGRDIGPDGHPKRGGFLPPVPLPRRMWAGGRLSFAHPLRVGDEVIRTSRIADIAMKDGRSGMLVFVTVRHEYADARGIAIKEEHDIVYRDMPVAGNTPARAGVAAPVDEHYSRAVAPDPVLLFRYSALTFNGHRIHYDRDYVTRVEGYPGLIVHGPLIATMLVDNLRRHHPRARLTSFHFRAVSPLFDIHPFTVCGRADGANRHQLWARNHEGALAMEGTAELA